MIFEYENAVIFRFMIGVTIECHYLLDIFDLERIYFSLSAHTVYEADLGVDGSASKRNAVDDFVVHIDLDVKPCN